MKYGEEDIKMILELPLDLKIQLLEDSLNGEFQGEFLPLAKIFLDAPESEGGLPTDLIESIRINAIKNNKNE